VRTGDLDLVAWAKRLNSARFPQLARDPDLGQ
jgi:hypothetical protein